MNSEHLDYNQVSTSITPPPLQKKNKKEERLILLNSLKCVY